MTDRMHRAAACASSLNTLYRIRFTVLFLFEIVRLGLGNLRLHLLRTVLTSLGIILGVSAVIVMVSIGEGNKQAALRDIQALGATNIIVRSVKPPESGTMGSAERSFTISYGLTERDMRRLEAAVPDADHMVPLKEVGSEVTHRELRMASQTFGTTPELIRVAQLRVEPGGRYLTSRDLETAAPVAVIGSEVAQKFFQLQDPVGSTFRVDEQVFRVVGVMRPVGLAGGAGSALVGRDLNKDIHIPITTARAQFGDVIMRRTAGSFSREEVQLSEIYVTAPSTEDVISMSERVRRVVAVEHPDMDDAQMVVPWELLENAKKTALVWNVLLIAVASVSLLVGGIGIMNIMLASVTERTREIGIRRALGATRRHITAQFLVETGSLAAVGGLIGIVVGVGVSIGIEVVFPLLLALPMVREMFAMQVQIETQVTGWSIIASFLVAALVGLVFGIYPAIQASKQDPIVALRHD